MTTMGRRNKGKKDEDEDDDDEESMDAREREKSAKDKKRPEVRPPLGPSEWADVESTTPAAVFYVWLSTGLISL